MGAILAGAAGLGSRASTLASAADLALLAVLIAAATGPLTTLSHHTILALLAVCVAPATTSRRGRADANWDTARPAGAVGVALAGGQADAL